MSWLFGFYSKRPNFIPLISKFHPKVTSLYIDSNLYIAAGGNDRLLSYQTKDNHLKFFVCGLGISANGDSFLGTKDWENLLASSKNVGKQNGHYCGIQIKDDSISFFTDPMGLRVIHIAESDDGWFFSTRLDWLLKTGAFEIDFEVFSSRWLLFNQISNKSIIKNIINLNCGSEAFISKNKIKINNYFWVPEKTNTLGADQFKDNLRKFVLLGEKQCSHISLGLSGGLDSRVLLSLLINSGYKNWDCYIFKSESRMDSVIAKKILTDFNLPFRFFSSTSSDTSEILSSLFEYIGTTCVTEPAFTSQKLMWYSCLSKNDVIIDGGFGEIWRREFLTRLYWAGPGVVENREIAKISKSINLYRADIFNENTNEKMRSGISNQLNHIIEILPPIKEIGFGNWLDIFSMKTRLVNYTAPEQARLDNYVYSYMPYIQFSLLNNLLNIPLSLRKSHKLFNKLIYPASVELTKYKLVKGNVPYPFNFNSFMKRIYSLAYSKHYKEEINNEQDIFLNIMKEFIMDSIRSSSVKNYLPYNYKNIFNYVNSYYNGEVKNSDYVNWFLTFEIFRQILEKNL